MTVRVRRAGIHSEVTLALALPIVGGDFQPGDQLPPADALAANLDVSRTVVREVIRVLAEKGLVESRQRSGIRVRDRTHWNLLDAEVIGWLRRVGPDLQFLRDLSAVRSAIESAAARLAAEHATQAEISEMWRLYARMQESVVDPQVYVSSDLLLHAAILKASHNVLLEQLTHTISAGLEATRDVTAKLESPEPMIAAMPHHARVIEAIAARDPRRAAEDMAALVARAISDVERLLEDSRAEQLTASVVATAASSSE